MEDSRRGAPGRAACFAAASREATEAFLSLVGSTGWPDASLLENIRVNRPEKPGRFGTEWAWSPFKDDARDCDVMWGFASFAEGGNVDRWPSCEVLDEAERAGEVCLEALPDVLEGWLDAIRRSTDKIGSEEIISGGDVGVP